MIGWNEKKNSEGRMWPKYTAEFKIYKTCPACGSDKLMDSGVVDNNMDAIRYPIRRMKCEECSLVIEITYDIHQVVEVEPPSLVWALIPKDN